MSCQTPTAIPNPCTEMIGGQPLNPCGRPLSLTDAIPYRDLLKMAEYDERAAELDGFRDRLARLAAEECRQKAEQIREHYRDLVADYGLAFCARQAAAEDGRYGNRRFF
ncbi:hypothetical protein [Methanoculleus sp. 7T]|uniref:hypothetical protein n=1 Tax=Methanoculleus sp. 7T TaxID=2937282 RepID=UPI0020C00FC0|nr:hypothetical protein [Methanoculleus sp. 7T]MCK8517718.1 hypothetical protein [Methanoculleus sp. 7T]